MATLQTLEAKVDELTVDNANLKIEIGRRAQEHQSQHAILQTKQRTMDVMKQKLESQRSGGGLAGTSTEV